MSDADATSATWDGPPADADLDRAAQELGPPEAVFRASPRWTRIKVSIGIGLVVWGVVANYVWWVHGPGKFGHYEFHLLFSPLIIGTGLLWFLYRNRGLRVAVYPTGLLRLRSNEVESVPFADVRVLRLKSDGGEPIFETDEAGRPVCRLPVRTPTFKVWDAWFELEQTDGTKTRFRAAVDGYSELAAAAQRHTFAQLWPQVQAAAATGEVHFGELVVTATGLTHAGKFLPWNELKTVKCESKILVITRVKGWRNFYAREISTVPNPHVLVALLEAFRQPPEPPEATELLTEPADA